MDIIRVIYKARPDVVWKNNSVNGYNLDTIKAAYIGHDFPNQAELTRHGWYVKKMTGLTES